MAKAKARKTRRAKQRRSKPPARRQAATPVPEAAAVAPKPKSPGFAEEYQYVIADLRRIFVLAAAMLAVLIVLALVLR